MATYYAWSPIHGSPDADGKAKVIKLGDSVSKSDVEDDADWDYLIEAGAIRTQQYPDDLGSGESPNDQWRRKMAELGAMGEMPAPPAVVEEVPTK